MTVRVSGFEVQTLQITGPVADPAVRDYIPFLKSIRVSLDVDQAPYVAASFEFQDLPDLFWANLEPRTSAGTFVSMLIRQRDLDANAIVSTLPGSNAYTATSTAPALLMVTAADRDPISGNCTVDAASLDQRYIDMTRNGVPAIDHGQGNLLALANWLSPGGLGTVADFMSASTKLIAAGDRRLVAPGEAHWDVLEPEAAAVGGRLYADLVGGMLLALSTDPPRVKPYTPPVISAHDPTVDGPPLVKLRERVDRADWADMVTAQYDWDDAAGTRHTAWWTSTGAGTKGRLVTYDRAKPGANQADEIKSRALLRGRSVTATCRADFRYVPGYDLVVNLAPGTADVNYGMIRRVEYTISGRGEAVMELTAQTGQPLA